MLKAFHLPSIILFSYCLLVFHALSLSSIFDADMVDHEIFAI